MLNRHYDILASGKVIFMRCHILFDFKLKEGIQLHADFDPSELLHTLHEDV